MNGLGATITADDLAYVKRLASYAAYKQHRQSLEDDFVSEICARLMARPMPSDPVHRSRYIRQTAGWAVADCLRRITVTPRRVITKIKAGTPLTAKERSKVGNLESVDFGLDWLKQIPAETPQRPPVHDVRSGLAAIAKKHPVEFCVLTMHFLYEAPLRDVAAFLGCTEPRACQLSKAGIKIMKTQLIKEAA